MNELKSFDSGYFIGKSNFEEDGTQHYLVFQPMYRYFKVITNTRYILSWNSKGLSAESFKPPTTSDDSLTPALNYYGTKTRVKFTGSCLKQSKNSYTHGKVVKIYIVYELGLSRIRFTKFFFHHNWNDGRLLLINMVYTSCFTSCRTT